MPSARMSSFICLIATISSVLKSFALYTLPKVPSPIFTMISYREFGSEVVVDMRFWNLQLTLNDLEFYNFDNISYEECRV